MDGEIDLFYFSMSKSLKQSKDLVGLGLAMWTVAKIQIQPPQI